MRYLSLLVAILAGTPAYASEYTHSIEIPPGFIEHWQAPRPFTAIMPGNTDVADAITGRTDRDVIILTKPGGGTSNILLVGENGEVVANLLVSNPTIQYHMTQDSTTKAWQVYRNDDKCFPVCVRLTDRTNAPKRRIVAPDAAATSSPPDGAATP
jgi:hypothetical protein